jgi:hypothetical protein
MAHVFEHNETLNKGILGKSIYLNVPIFGTFLLH